MKTFLLIILVIFAIGAYSQTDCDKLTKYRDNQLYNKYVTAQSKYEISSEKFERYKSLKKELENVEFGSTSKTIGEIALKVEALCKLSKDLLGVLPGTKALSASEEIAFLSVDVIQKKFIEGKDVETVVNEVAVDQIKSLIFKHLNPAFQAVDAIDTYYDKLSVMKEFSNEAKEHLNSIKEQMTNFQNFINKYQIEVNLQANKLEYVNRVKNAIDKYCGGKPIIKVIANMDCYISYDFGEKTMVAKNDKVEFETEKGEHFISTSSIDGKEKWDTTINVTGTGLYKVTIGLIVKGLKMAPVLLIANELCELEIEGNNSYKLEKGKGMIIELPVGTHKLSAKTINDNEWRETIKIENEIQKVIKIEFEANIENHSNGTFTDPRDGQTYTTIRIGTQIWMAENLKYNIGNSLCYEKSSYNCNKYGRLYDWQTAKNACPSGWHLPSKSEFETLVGDGSNTYNALKEAGSNGFSALLGGFGLCDGDYRSIGKFGSFWSSSQYKNYSGWVLNIVNAKNKDAGVGGPILNEWVLSVRCLQD